MRVSTLLILLVLIAGGAIYAWREGWFESAVAAANRSFSLHYDKGQALYLTAKYGEAIQEFQKALETDPRNLDAPAALARMGDCYKELKQYQRAIQMYDRVLDEFPGYKMRGIVEQSREKVKGLL